MITESYGLPMVTYSTETVKCEIEKFAKYLSIIKSLNSYNDKELLILCCALRLEKSIGAINLLVLNKFVHESYSAIRNCFETMVWLVATWRHSDFNELESRLHANFLIDQIDLIEIMTKSGSYKQFETFEEANIRIKTVKEELSVIKSKGINPFCKNPTDNLSTIGKIPFIKRHYYKLFSLFTHPSLHGLEAFLNYDPSNSTIEFVTNIEPDSNAIIFESLGTFLNITNSILNQFFKLGFNDIDPDELLTSTELKLSG